uniref:Uncharacterized protein n=1 Tax=Vespula pensylvanica TaxID=30213 RepID=A0A834P4B0_VESPE|nr:hypothetical protein H0235_007216 [Vespula pensylvanica]
MHHSLRDRGGAYLVSPSLRNWNSTLRPGLRALDVTVNKLPTISGKRGKRNE